MDWKHFLFASLFGAIGGWLHRALTVRPEQLKIKAQINQVVKGEVQTVLNAVIPQLAEKAKEAADIAIGKASASMEGGNAGGN